MAFVKEYRNLRDEFPEWEYLNSIGVRDMYGRPIKDSIKELVVDRENNYFFIPRGRTNINRDNEEICLFALCMDDRVINIEVEENRSGHARDNSFECHWVVRKVVVPEDNIVVFKDREYVKSVITDALITKTYNKKFTPERTRAVTVDFVTPLDYGRGL